MSRNRKDSKVLSRMDVGLITLISLIAFGILIFSGTLIWLLLSL